MVTLVNKVRDKAAQAVCEAHDNRPDELLEILHDMQDQQGFLSDDALRTIAHCLNISQAEIHGVVSFYHDFRRSAGAGLRIRICRAEACQAVGCQSLIEDAEAGFGMALGEEKGDIALEAVYCLGNCALGPAALIGEVLIGRATLEKLEEVAGRALAAGAAQRNG